MARNGSGVYTNPNPDFVSGTTISSSEVDANFSDIATALTQSIAVDGQTTITENLPMNSKKLTGLADGSAAADSTALHQIQDQDGIWCGTAGGTANALTLTPTPAITAYAAGQKFIAIIGGAPTSSSATVAVSGLATKAIEIDGSALSASVVLEAGKLYSFIYDGTAFQATRLSGIYLVSADIGVSVQAYDADTLKADVADVLTAGFAATPYSAGTKTTGTFTPDEANGNLQYAVNGGAHTLAPPTNNCTLIIQYTNDGSAGAITTSGFTLVDGDTISTTNGDDFFFYITKLNGFSHLTVKALQ